MAIFLYKVEECWRNPRGLLTLEQGMRMSEIKQRPQLKRLIQGIQLELRRPDGSTHHTYLFNYGFGAIRAEDGTLIRDSDPYLHFILPPEVSENDVPPGTEIWWLENEAGLTKEEIARRFEAYLASGNNPAAENE